MLWSGPTNNPANPNEMFRVELEPGRILLVWYDPNPHTGHEFDERHSLSEFLTQGNAHDSIRSLLGDAVLREVLAEVTRLIG